MTEPSARELAVFSEARRLPAGQRAAFLDQACAGDAALRQHVEALLQAGEEAGDFLQNPAAVPPHRGETARLPLAPSEKPGDRIGRYRLLQQIGEGGCGVVYMAEQDEPVRRMVALKVIKLGMDTKEVIARFEAERQALAMMDHPNIAKVLDAAATETGRPFFVMELVRGVKFTDYCDHNNLPTRERLALFVQVCQAVQHAHQKGIIHRDLKPSNILVTHRDGVPVPKVIDFGIAKATTDQRLTDKTLFTAFEQFIGTPAYMSPEQAEMSELGIDTRSDIYSLGVLLYELLTGQTPFDSRKLVQAGVNEIRRVLREDEPPRPSTRLSTMAASDLTQIARHRQIEPARISTYLRRDLDWIVMKCLEKERGRRYETANGLAMDVQRFLQNEPVLAAAPTASYRIRKWVRRHRVLVAASSLVLLSLVAGIVGTTWGLLAALREKREAQRQAKIARHATAFLTGMFESIDPQEAKLRDITVREILDQAGEKIGTAFPGDPMTEWPLRRTMTDIYTKLGRGQEALKHAEAAYRLAQVAHPEIDHSDTAQALTDLAAALRTVAALDKALTNAQAALAMWQRLRPGDDTNVARGLLLVGDCLHDLEHGEEALAKYRQALAIEQRIYKGDHADVADTLENVATCLGEAGHLDEALPQFQAALEMDRRVFKGDHPVVALALDNVGDCLQLLGRYNDALTNHQQAVAMDSRIYKGDHPQIASDLGDLSECLTVLGRIDEALAMRQQILEMNRRIYQGDHPQVAKSLNLLASGLERSGRWPEALQKHQEALAMWQRVYHADHSNIAYELGDVGRCLQYEGLYSNALPNFEFALAMDQRLFKGDHPAIAGALVDLANCLDGLDRSTEALPKHEQALAMRQRIYSGDHPDVVASIGNLGRCFEQLGRFPEAISNEEAAVAMAQRIFKGDNSLVVRRLNDLGRCHQEVGQWSAALTNEQAALAMVRRMHQADHEYVAAMFFVVGDTLSALGRRDEARQQYQQAAAMFERLAAAQAGNDVVESGISKSHLRLGNLYNDTQEAGKATDEYRTGLRAIETLLARNPSNIEAQKFRRTLRAKLNLEKFEAVLNRVWPGGQSERYGLRKGDVLTRYDGEPVVSADDILMLTAHATGNQIEVEFRRDGTPLKLTFQPGPLGATFEDRVQPAG